MSQIFKRVTSGTLPPDVATSYVTDDGTAIPAANTLNVLGDDTTEYNANGLTTEGSGDTVTVLLTNRVQGSTSTTGAVTGDVITFAMGAVPGTFRFDVQVTGFESTTPAGAGYGLEICARTTGAVATLIDVDVNPQEEAALSACSCTAVVSGNNLIVRVTGTIGLTINWSGSGTYERAI